MPTRGQHTTRQAWVQMRCHGYLPHPTALHDQWCVEHAIQYCVYVNQSMPAHHLWP